MKAYLMTVLIIDHDHIGVDGIKGALEHTRYPNRCISPSVTNVIEADIGEWTDDHPLDKAVSDHLPYFEDSE